MQDLEKPKNTATDFDLNQLSEFLILILSFPVRVQSQTNENIEVFELDCESTLLVHKVWLPLQFEYNVLNY